MQDVCKTDEGHTCVFPFKYRGKTYNKCTSAGRVSLRGTKWCATEVKPNGNYKNWGKCVVSSCGKLKK